MIVYRYDPQTRFYTGTLTLDDSDKSPSGKWQIPAYCVETKPNDTTDKVKPRWTGTEWEYIDTADVTVYYDNGLSHRTEKYDYTPQEKEAILPEDASEEEIRKAFPGYDEAVKQKKLDELDSQFQSDKQGLQNYYVELLLMSGDTADLESLKAEMLALQEKYDAEYEAIINGEVE